MNDDTFDLFCIGLALITGLFASGALVWIRWDRQQWKDWRQRHLWMGVPDDLDI